MIQIEANRLVNGQFIKEARFTPASNDASAQLVLTMHDGASESVSGQAAEATWTVLQLMTPQPTSGQKAGATRRQRRKAADAGNAPQPSA